MKKLLALLLAALLLPVSGQALEADKVREHNDALSRRWVNWYPSGWSAEPFARQEIQGILAELGEREDLPLALHDWICESIFFDRDALNAGIYSTLSPSQVLRERRGVCEAIANLAQALFLEAGIPCVKVWGAVIPEGERWENTDIDPSRINHTWNEFYADGRWITMDCTMDMGNEYIQGRFVPGAVSHTFLNPDPAYFAESHLILERGSDWPENIPDDWAKGELEQAVSSGLVPLSALGNYRADISADELLTLLGLPSENAPGPLTRLGAARVAAQWVDPYHEAPAAPYQDTGALAPEDRKLLDALYQSGIMEGDGFLFRPGDALSRQEAILLITRIYGGI